MTVVGDQLEWIAIALPLHGRAFDRGFITLQRLMEVLITPFAKLAARVSQMQNPEMINSKTPEGGAHLLREALFGNWSKSILKVIEGHNAEGAQGLPNRTIPLIRPEKRTELIKAMLKAQFHQVFNKGQKKLKSRLGEGDASSHGLLRTAQEAEKILAFGELGVTCAQS